MVRRVRPFIRQHETHRQLAGRMLPAALNRRRATLDAIIVPASRTASNLDHAVALAKAMNCWLVVFCSRQARGAEVGALAADKRFSRALAVDLPPDYSHKLLDFASSGVTRGDLPAVCENPNGDLSTKRNLGLLLARMVGWERIFFMDDDIRNVAADDLRATTAMLGRYCSVGMRVGYFPDNSVVCHAHRQTGAAQDVFVSGSVLAVNSMRPFNFFPEVYNEDWLFFYDDARSGQLGSSDRHVTQLSYDPFEQPQRAERQEFGDVLAEGLYALLDRGLGVEAATCEYWNQFLVARRDFLEEILKRSDQAAHGIPVKMVSAVQTAMISLMQTRAIMYQKYVEAWRKDITTWSENVTCLPRSPSIESALGELDLTLSESGPAGNAPPSTILAAITPPDSTPYAGPFLPRSDLSRLASERFHPDHSDVWAEQIRCVALGMAKPLVNEAKNQDPTLGVSVHVHDVSSFGCGLAHAVGVAVSDHDAGVMQKSVEQADGGGCVLGQEPASEFKGPATGVAELAALRLKFWRILHKSRSCYGLPDS